MNKKFGYKYDPETNTVTQKRRNKHMLQTPKGWAIDKEWFEEYPNANYELTNTETGVVYKAPGVKIAGKGIHLNRGFGDQILLVIDEWEASDSNQEKLI